MPKPNVIPKRTSRRARGESPEQFVSVMKVKSDSAH